ncbi:hypothetical protein [Labrys neptuniae]|uniref:hypothetical protein n=1 Tax=Labrys neptuniae TaxID=376174 RepID=UPI00373FD3B5
MMVFLDQKGVAKRASLGLLTVPVLKKRRRAPCSVLLIKPQARTRGSYKISNILLAGQGRELGIRRPRLPSE